MNKTLLISSILIVFVLFIFVSCKDNKQAKSTDSQNVVESQIHEEEEQEAEEEEKEANRSENIITQNEGEYAKDLLLFEDREVAKRLHKLGGEDYDDILTNFQTQTPIVSDEGIYKFTGCKEHDCPAYHTTILYDAENDNFNILIDKNGKVKTLREKEEIKMSKKLEDEVI